MLLAALALISACHPDYVRDSSYSLARSGGLSDDYAIQRNTNFALPLQSDLCVASGDETDRHGVLVTAVADAFSERFSNVSVIRQASQEHASRADLACHGAAFLIQAYSLDARCETSDGGAESADSQVNERCSEAHVRLKILSVAAASTVDIVDIRYSGSWTGAQPASYQGLIAPGLHEAARLLAGR